MRIRDPSTLEEIIRSIIWIITEAKNQDDLSNPEFTVCYVRPGRRAIIRMDLTEDGARIPSLSQSQLYVPSRAFLVLDV